MKQIKFFAVALAALTMFSCSKENVATPDNNAPGEKAKVTIKFANSDTKSKAAGRPTDISDAKIVDYSIFLFREGGVLDGKVYGSGKDITTSTAVDVTGTTAATSIYVVANAGDLTGKIGSKEALEKELILLTKMADGTGTATQANAAIYMSGSEVVKFADKATTAAVDVDLKFVGAKLALTVDYTGATGAYGTDFKINRVFVMNAGGVSKLFGTSLIPSKTDFVAVSATPYFVSGISAASMVPTWTNVASIYGVSTSLVTDFTDEAAVGNGAHFYVFEQDGKTQEDGISTTLVVEATWISGSNKTIYFPVKFTAEDAGKTITRGNSYNVNITLKGDFSKPGDGGNGGGGTTDPGEDIIASTVTVTITPATWTAVPVSKTFE